MSKNYKDTGLGTFKHGLNLLRTGVSRTYGNYKKERWSRNYYSPNRME
jgi:hypothetical protein